MPRKETVQIYRTRKLQCHEFQKIKYLTMSARMNEWMNGGSRVHKDLEVLVIGQSLNRNKHWQIFSPKTDRQHSPRYSRAATWTFSTEYEIIAEECMSTLLIKLAMVLIHPPSWKQISACSAVKLLILYRKKLKQQGAQILYRKKIQLTAKSKIQLISMIGKFSVNNNHLHHRQWHLLSLKFFPIAS